jgi:hypothetical protein
MGATTPNVNTQALPVIPSKFWDNINTLAPTLMKFVNKNEKQDGGLYYAPNRIALKDTGGSWISSTSNSAVLTASQTSDLLNEQYTWKYVINDMLLTLDQQVRAGESPYTKITALEASKYQAKQRHIQLMSTGIMTGDGTSNTPIGLQSFITPTDVFGGVDPANDPDWTPQTSTSATTLSGPSIVETMIDNASWLSNKPTIGPTTRTLFSRCKAIWGQGLTYEAKDNGQATYGLEKIFIRGGLGGGTVELYWDDYMPANNMWLIDDTVVHVKQHSSRFMEVHNPERPQSGLDIIMSEVGYVFSALIFGAELRRTSGGWTNLTA